MKRPSVNRDCTPAAARTLRRSPLFTVILWVTLSLACISPASAQPDLIVTGITARALNSWTPVGTTRTYVAEIVVTVMNIGTVTAPLVQLSVRMAPTLRPCCYEDLLIYRCNPFRSATCRPTATSDVSTRPVMPGATQRYRIPVEIVTQAADWGRSPDWTTSIIPLEGGADIPSAVACVSPIPFIQLVCVIAELTGGVNRTTGCSRPDFCFRFLATVNQDNLAGELPFAKINNWTVRTIRVPPRGTRPLGDR